MSPEELDAAAGCGRFAVRSGEARIHGEIWGEGEPLVLLHGWTLDQRVFRPQVQAFSHHFRTITFDRRGCGQSRAVPDLSRELEDIGAVIDYSCDNRPVHLLGMSQGGRLALRYSITRPGRVRSLVLQGPALDQFSAEERDDECVPMAEFVQLAKAGKMEELRTRWLAHPMMNRGIDTAAAALLAQILADYDGEDLRRLSARTFEFPVDKEAALRELSIPVLILTGEWETVARKRHAARLMELLPKAEEYILPRSGHLSNLCDPGLYNEKVLEFCRAH